MGRWVLVAAAVAVAGVAGCDRDPKDKDYADQALSTELMIKPPPPSLSGAEYRDAKLDSYAPAAAGAPAAPAEASPQSASALSIPVGVAMLAYSYQYALDAPARNVRALLSAHEAACRAAGPARCQVTASGIEEAGQDNVTGNLTLQAEPGWLTTFRGKLDGQAKAAGGRVASTSTSTEDLSREIVDTEARLKAMTSLRDRLQALLASHPGKLQELLEVERELARVQGEIDSTASQIALMRARVATSIITLSYRSEGVVAPDGALSPLKSAMYDFLGLMVGVIAFLIRAIAVLLPLAGVGLLLTLAWRRWRRGKPPLFRRRANPARVKPLDL